MSSKAKTKNKIELCQTCNNLFHIRPPPRSSTSTMEKTRTKTLLWALSFDKYHSNISYFRSRQSAEKYLLKVPSQACEIERLFSKSNNLYCLKAPRKIKPLTIREDNLRFIKKCPFKHVKLKWKSNTVQQNQHWIISHSGLKTTK